MTIRAKALANILFVVVTGPLLALSLLIPLPLTETQADRAFGGMVRTFAGKAHSAFTIGHLSELDRMRSADIVYVSCTRPDAAREWDVDTARIRLISNNIDWNEFPKNSALIRIGPDWFKGDRVFTTSAAYGTGTLGMHGVQVFLHRSWLGFWFIAYSTWVS